MTRSANKRNAVFRRRDNCQKQNLDHNASDVLHVHCHMKTDTNFTELNINASY